MDVKEAYAIRSAAMWRWSFDKLNPSLLVIVCKTDEALVQAVYDNVKNSFRSNHPNPLDKVRKQISCIPAVEESIAAILQAAEDAKMIDIEVG